MLQKKYSPIVLTQASAFAFHLVQQAIRFVLKDEMVRLFHFTIDEARFTDPDRYDGRYPFHQSEMSAAVLCKDEKVVDIEGHVTLIRGIEGGWSIDDSRIEGYCLRFPKCKALKNAMVCFRGNYMTDEIKQFTVWVVNVSSIDGHGPDDPPILEVRTKLLT